MRAVSGRILAVVVSLATVSSGFLTVGAAPASAEPPGPHDRVKGSWIVLLEKSHDPEQESDDVAADHGGEAEYVYDEVLHGFNFRGPDDRWDDLLNDPRVDRIVPDLPAHKTADTIPAGIDRVDARDPNGPDAHELGFDGSGVFIGILDTGVDLDHPDLNVNSSMGRACSTSSMQDADGHGTHVAGTAAARANGSGVLGAAPGAVVIPVKVLNNSGSGSTSTITCGVNHMKSLAQNNPGSRFVANMSLSGGGGSGHCGNGSLRQAVCEAKTAGVVFAVAAGNERTNASGSFPANYPETITVSAITDYDGEPGGNAGCKSEPSGTECDDRFWSFSNHGNVVDITAPGVRVLSTRNGGGTQTRLGTSMASPHVAGVAAVLLQADPSLTADEVKNHLVNTGMCPNGETNSGGGDCSGQGNWGGNDNDGNPEPAVNALKAVEAYGGLPEISWTAPGSAETLSGTESIQITATDEDDASSTLDVDWRVDGGTWRETTGFNIVNNRHTASWNTTDTGDGFVELEARATDSDDFTAFATIHAKVVNGSTVQLLEDFEDTPPNPTWTTSGLWDRQDDSGCISQAYSSETHAYYFGDGSCDYNTGNRATGHLTSPAVPVGDTATLSFQHWREVESYGGDDFDVATVDVSYDDGSTWQNEWMRSSRHASERAWTPVSLELAPTSSSMRVRFGFDSIDNQFNNHRGWFIDDVKVISNGPPSVSWNQPADGASNLSGDVPVRIEATDPEGESLTVDWRVDGGPWTGATDTNNDDVYEATWDSDDGSYADGSHTLEARARDSGGSAATDQITVTTKNAPSVSWDVPANNQEVSGNVLLGIDATDPNGDSLTVTWQVDGGTPQSASYDNLDDRYEATWNSASVPDGNHTLKATAEDPGGNSATAQITVTTENVDDPPQVAWVEPAGGSTVRGDVALQFDASDADSSPLTASWRYEPGGTYQTVTDPNNDGRYEATWDSTGVEDGTYTLRARAQAEGKTTTKTIQVQVLNDVLLFSDATDTSGWSTGGLWHPSSACGSPSSGSGHPAWYYGQDSSCNYATGSRTQGYLTSPQVGDLGSEVVLDLRSARNVESYSGGAYDRTHIEVSWNGGSSWGTIYSRDSRNGSNGSWEDLHFELPTQGSTFQVRFWFDSRDGRFNNFTGWRLDDIEATTNRAPSVSWTAPGDEDEVDGNVPIGISADDPEDADGTLTVEWRVDGGGWQAASHDSGTSYTDSWSSASVSDGPHTLEARVTDAGGLTATQSINVTTENVDSPPEIAWVSPTDGATVQGDSVQIAFDATDPEGEALTGVQWRVDDGTWQNATDPDNDDRYTATWNSEDVEDGEHTLTARASDGASTPEEPITVQVANDGPPVLGEWDGTSTSGWSLGGLWKASGTSCVPTGSTSGRPAFYYGRDGGNCDYNTGSRTQGFLTSPLISGVGETVHLHFDYWRQVESYSGAYDRTRVQVSYDNGSTWSTVWNRDSRDPSDATWKNEHLTLTAAGEQMRVRFWFDSRDDLNNGLRGWIIDDIRVTTEGEPPSSTRFEASAEEPGRWETTGMWHDTSGGCTPSGQDAPVFYYGRDSSCTYDNGSATSGALTSPVIDGVGSSARLTFRHWREVESYGSGPYDITRVQVSYGGGSWSTVWQLDSRNASQASWQSATVNLSPTAPDMRLRFLFNTRDNLNNGFTGWFVDDVVVENT